MRCYQICQNAITALASAPDSIPDDGIVLRRAAEIDPKRFPLSRLVELHNTLPDVDPVRRFGSRPVGVKTFWAALGKLPLGTVDASATSKQAKVTALLRRPQGADLSELMTATSWQAHSIRGLLSGVLRKRLCLSIDVTVEGERRVYRVAA